MGGRGPSPRYYIHIHVPHFMVEGRRKSLGMGEAAPTCTVSTGRRGKTASEVLPFGGNKLQEVRFGLCHHK